jgi:hypothetical protein
MMSAPTVKVELGLDIGVLDPTNFILDDPIKGLLDNTDFTLSGPKFLDITDKVQSLSVSRGKSQALDRNNAGLASVTVDNTTRLFDPLFASGIYFGQLVPRREVRVTANDLPVMLGYIEDFDLGYKPGSFSQATIDVADAFSTLTNSELENFTPPTELSGARINRILDRAEVAWPANRRSIDTGNSSLLDAEIEAGTNTLTYLQLVESSEYGNVFIAKDGKFTFKQRNTVPNPIAVSFTDNPAGTIYNPIPFTDLNVVYGSENLFNRITLENDDSVPIQAFAEDIDSQNLYGVRAYNQTGLLVGQQTQLQFLADFLLARFSQPQYRFDSLTVNLDVLTKQEQDLVLGLELGDLVEVQFTPSEIPPAIEQFSKIIGISQEWNPSNKKIKFALERLDFSLFILDDPVLGLLDQDRLSF